MNLLEGQIHPGVAADRLDMEKIVAAQRIA